MAQKKPGTPVFNKQMNRQMHLIRTYKVNGDVRAIYSDMTEKFASLILGRQRNQYQSVIVIAGRTGSGKSNLAVQLARAIDPSWSITDNYIYSVSDLRAKLRAFKKDPTHTSRVNLMDEGTVILSNRNVMSREDKAIITIFETMRSLGMITLICAPAFGRLNVTIRENLCDFLIMCPDKPVIEGYRSRGFYEVFEPVYNRWTQDLWWKALGTGVYPPLEGELKEEYERIKLEHQQKLTKEFINKDDDEEDIDDIPLADPNPPTWARAGPGRPKKKKEDQ